jgi:ribonuclease-3
MDTNRKEQLQKFLKNLGHFNVSRDALERYDRSFTHRSFSQEQRNEAADNERLEFLGDRVLNFVVAEHLFATISGSEGELTARMECTRNKNLASLVELSGTGLGTLVLTGKGQKKTDRIIAGAFEAFIAAFYLDCGLERTKDIILMFFSKGHTDFGVIKNHKKILQEHLQKQGLPPPVYELESRSGADHEPRFVFIVRINGEIAGRGSGRNKTEATQSAARDALWSFSVS